MEHQHGQSKSIRQSRTTACASAIVSWMHVMPILLIWEARLDYLQPRCTRHLLSWMYRVSKDDTQVPTRALRGNSKVKLKVSRHHKDVYLKSPLHRGARLWGRLLPVQQHKATKKAFLQSLTERDLVPLDPIIVWTDISLSELTYHYWQFVEYCWLYYVFKISISFFWQLAEKRPV